MKPLKIMMVLIGAIVFSGCSTQLKIIHVPVDLKDPCLFEKYTESEKDTMSEEVGRKTARNQNACRIRHQRNNDIIKKHNESHTKED